MRRDALRLWPRLVAGARPGRAPAPGVDRAGVSLRPGPRPRRYWWFDPGQTYGLRSIDVLAAILAGAQRRDFKRVGRLLHPSLKGAASRSPPERRSSLHAR